MQAGNRIGIPLKGLRVLDLTTFLSGPFCTQVLADLGAEVVKVESPDGDSSRRIPPHFVGEDSAYFLGINRGKRSIAVNLKTGEGIELLKRLIAKADVLVENFRPGVASRMGLDVDVIRAAHPGLIWASISGFGQTGPWRDQPAYDMIVQALSGVMSLTGEAGRPAVRLGIPAGDTVAGLYACIAINAALVERSRTGQGCHIDVAMLDCQLAMLSYQSTYALVAGVTPGPQGAKHDSIPTYRSFRAGDGRELVVTANTEKMWKGLCNTLSLPSLASDPLYSTASQRLANKASLWPILEEAFEGRSAAEWVRILHENDVPAALIKTVPEALLDARQSGRSMLVALESAEGQQVEVVGNPIRFAGARTAIPTYPPSLGRDNRTVLQEWLAIGQTEVSQLEIRQVLRKAKDSAEVST